VRLAARVRLAAGRAVVAGAILVAGATLLVGCTDASRATIAPSGAPASAVPTARATSVAPTATAPAVTIGPGQTTAEDPTLLAILPATVAGASVSQEPASFPEAIHDPSFVANVDRAVFFVIVDGNDLASGVVAHLRAGSWSDKFFGDWRASYDDGACAQSGGVVAHAETTSGGRTVYVTTCGGGLRVYHAYVESRGAVVSILSTGSRLFGGQLMAGIRG
jgi:hypothetical protein